MIWSLFGFIYKIGNYTDRQAWYARGLVDQPAHLKSRDCTDHRVWYARALVDSFAHKAATHADYELCLTRSLHTFEG